MTESYLTTDIIVIIVLVVVLVVIGLCAFLTHFYWTKIGVSEIWNTAKWSSMRSSFYRTVRRFSRTSRASSARSFNERPFSAASRISENPVNNTLPTPLKHKRGEMTSIAAASTEPVPHRSADHGHGSAPSGTAAAVQPSSHRRNSSNQVQPVSAISYQNSSKNPTKPAKTHAAASNWDNEQNGEASVTIHTRPS